MTLELDRPAADFIKNDAVSPFTRRFIPNRFELDVTRQRLRPQTIIIESEAMIRPLNHDDTPRSSDQAAAWAKVVAVLIVLLLVAGVAGVALAPSRLTRLGVPLGLTLLAIFAWMLDRQEARSTHGDQ